ncbi:zf-HC2 domain-containing protein [Helcococcus ovis]|uniref:zf-HC2 domain-containing protein n=1 Tax=Helcococcus ovis TaxID=72026 RepID=UPI0038BDF9B6
MYVDDALSDTSKKIVEDHFSECEECSKLFEEIKIEHERAIKKRQEYESQVEDFSRRIKKKKKNAGYGNCSMYHGRYFSFYIYYL